ncbi:MAG: GDSL-type esterase/lipase family protein [Pseudomonadota bacterium]
MEKIFGNCKIGQILINFALVLASTAIVIIFFELGLRALGYSPSYFSPWAANLWKNDPYLGWINAEGQQGFFEHPQFRVSVNINSKSLRDIEHSPEKSKQTKRVLILGDSFVWGFGVEAEQRFSNIIQKEVSSTTNKVEVINAGVSGWSTDQELLWLEKYGLSYNPDLVILLFYQNDLEDNLRLMVNNFYRKPRFVLKDDGELILTGTPCPHASRFLLTLKYLRNHSSIVALLGNLTYRSGLNIGNLIFGNANVTRETDKEIRLSLTLLLRMNNILSQKGIPFVLVTYCEGDRSCAALSSLAKENDIILLNVDKLEGYSRDVMTIKGDGHWNAVGHSFVGKALAEFLQNQKILQ